MGGVSRAARAERFAFVGGTGLVLALAGVFWATALRQGAPFVYHPDEPAVMAHAMRIAHTGNLNPAWFHYPSLCIYLETALTSAVHAVTRVPLAPGGELLFEGARTSVITYYVAGRALTVAFSLGATVLTVLVARRLAGAWASLLAGVAFATSPLVFHSAIFTTVDMPLTFFTTLGTLLCMHAVDPEVPVPRWWFFAAIVAAGALAAGAKYNGALALVVFAGVFLSRRGVNLRSFAELLGYALLAVDLFVLTTPYSVLDVPHFWSVDTGLPAEFIHYRTGHFGADTGSSTEKAIWTLRVMVGPLAWLAVPAAALVGARRLERRRGRQALVVLATFTVFAIPIAAAKVFFQRNCLPLVPLVLAFGALGVRALVDFARAHVRAAPLFLWALAGVFAMLQARTSYAAIEPELAARAHADPRNLAQDWAIRNIPRGSSILREAFTPHLHLVDSFAVESVFAIGSLPPSTLDQYDYVVTSSSMWQLFPDIGKTAYARLFSTTPAFEAAPASIQGYGDFPDIRIYRTKPVDPPDLESRTVFRLSEEDGFSGMNAFGKLSLTRGDGSQPGHLVAKVTGRDAGFLLPDVPSEGPRRYLLRLSMDAPGAATLRLFYSTPAEPGYDERRSFTRRIVAGENHADIRFGPVELGGRLRLDLGERTGSYRMREIALYTLPE